MWDGYEDAHVGVDTLVRLQIEIEEQAKACSIEVRLVGRLLKFTPIGVYTKVLLELDEPSFGGFPVIYRHRTSELTSLHKGKAVSASWVAGFLEHNSSEARKAVAEKQAEFAKKQNEEDDTQRRTAKTNRIPLKRVQCKACDGEGRWSEGDPRDGDARFEYCSECHGAGYVDA